MEYPGIAESIAEKVKDLPLENQQEVLDFVEFLRWRASEKRPRRKIRGLWSDLGVEVTEEDIVQARREIWGSFPRENV